jgi:hypothetical protein
MCGSPELVPSKGKLVCKKCGHSQRPRRDQYTYPLSEPVGDYVKKPY